MDCEAAVQALGKPKLGQVLELVRWISSKAEKFKMPDGVAGIGIMQALITKVDDQELLEAGKILLGPAGAELTTEDLELGWLSEALAKWAEGVDLARVLKNIERVTKALGQ